MMSWHARLRTAAPLLALVVAACLPLVWPEHFWLHVFNLTLLYALLALGQNIITGWCGMLTLGQAAFLGLGAYTSALLVTRLGVPWVLAFLCAGFLSAGIGALLALPCLRVKSDFLSLVTIAFNQIFFVVANNWIDLTRGPMGMPNVPPINLFGFALRTTALQFWFFLAIMTLVYAGVGGITAGPIGRAWAMIRDDETAARAVGVDVTRYKVLAFAIGCFVCGLAGSLYAHYLRIVSPDMFRLEESLLMMQMAILGGLASLPGSILGAFLMVMIPEALRSSQPWLVTLRPGIAGAILVGMMIWRPNGLLGATAPARTPLRGARSALRRLLGVFARTPGMAR
jgi:branched-chain amino acid transport system permease protein